MKKIQHSRFRFLLLLALPLLSACGGGEPEETAEADAAPENPLLQPHRFRETAPEEYRVRLQTTQGDVVIQVHRGWAPMGADRFYNLVKAGYYEGVPFHRVVEGFVAEFGIHPDPWVNAAWRQATMEDDPVTKANLRGRVTFSKNRPDTRTVQVFINLDDNRNLDTQGFAPFGEVVEGMDVVESLYAEYGDGPPRGEGVYQSMAIAKGDEYFDEEFPLLDRIQEAEIVEEGG